MENKKTSVLIADDHPLILEGLVKQFEACKSFHIIGIANNGEKAWQLFNEHTPQIAILDIEMAGMDGIELTAKIKAANTSTKVVLLTMHTSPWIIAQAKKANPDSILLKSMPLKDIVNSINLVLEYGCFFPLEIEKLIKRNSHEFSSIQSISNREMEVLKLISEGYTTHQIAEKLFLSENTIETYRKNLLIKFETPNVACLIKKAVELGVI
ncbi:MAG: response regulator [Bacteroidales bacterium]